MHLEYNTKRISSHLAKRKYTRDGPLYFFLLVGGERVPAPQTPALVA